MSWSINMVGTKADVKAAFTAQPYVPQSLKDTVTAFCDEKGADGEPSSPEAIQVKTSGHLGGSWSSVTEFTITPIMLAHAPAPATPDAPGTATSSPPLDNLPTQVETPTGTCTGTECAPSTVDIPPPAS